MLQRQLKEQRDTGETGDIIPLLEAKIASLAPTPVEPSIHTHIADARRVHTALSKTLAEV